MQTRAQRTCTVMIECRSVPVTRRDVPITYRSLPREVVRYSRDDRCISTRRRAVTSRGGICEVMFTQTSPVLPFFATFLRSFVARLEVRFTYTLYT